MTTRVLIPATLLLFVVLSASSILLATGDDAPEWYTKQPTVAEKCTDNWNNSTADKTCSNESIVQVINSQCRVTADCKTKSGDTNNTYKVVLPDDADRLENCDGTLKLDSC